MKTAVIATLFALACASQVWWLVVQPKSSSRHCWSEADCEPSELCERPGPLGGQCVAPY